MENKKYFKVIAKCGHVGKKHYIPIAFPICAESASAAAQKAKSYPRVKKQLKDSIISTTEITKKEFKELIDINRKDPYLSAKVKKDHYSDESLEERVQYNETKRKYDPYYEETHKQNKAYLHKKMLLRTNPYSY